MHELEPTLCSVISSRLANSVRAHPWGPKIKIRRTERKDGRERLGTNFLSITWDKINSCFTAQGCWVGLTSKFYTVDSGKKAYVAVLTLANKTTANLHICKNYLRRT